MDSFSIWYEEVILPEQFQEKTSLTGEQRLLLAVLEDAILTCAGKPRSGAGPRSKILVIQEAWAWVESDEDGWPFAFFCVCAGLGINPLWLRQKIKKAFHGTR